VSLDPSAFGEHHEPPLGEEEREILVRLLDLAADEFANHGCNDFELDNTDANWALWQDALSDEEGLQRPKGPKIYAEDWILMRYLAHRIKRGAK
jgi:hypothetical protein